MQECKSSVHWQ